MASTITLQHGTTLSRANRIVAAGPNPNYVEPGGTYHDPAGGLSTYPSGHQPANAPDVAEYARRKSANFPNEGGPVILEVEVPNGIVDIVRTEPVGQLAINDSGEIRFEPGMGLEELLQEWTNLTKRIIPV